jgi:hypothetical protein
MPLEATLAKSARKGKKKSCQQMQKAPHLAKFFFLLLQGLSSIFHLHRFSRRLVTYSGLHLESQCLLFYGKAIPFSTQNQRN